MTTDQAVVLSAEAIRGLAEVDLEGVPEVTHKILWRDPTSMAGIMRVPQGEHLGAHAHRQNHHHMWVLEGSAEILGKVLGPGSYVHVPHGVDHDIDARRTEGCTVYYLYIRPS